MYVAASKIGREPGALDWACVNGAGIDVVLVLLLVVLLAEKELIRAYRGGDIGAHGRGLDVIILPLVAVFGLIILRSLLELMHVVL
jgi:hypothetical protein